MENSKVKAGLQNSTITHFNGGIEQAILEIVNEDNLLNDADKKRLEYLQSLPQNRVEQVHHSNHLDK